MRPKPALVILALSMMVGGAWITLPTQALSQDTEGENARGDTERFTSSLELGQPYDLQTQYQFEQQLTPDERALLISLKPRFAIADTDCPLPTSEPVQPFYVKFHGPLDRALANELSAVGASFLGYAYPHAHFIRALDAAALERIGLILRDNPKVAGTLLREPMDACSGAVWADYNNPGVNGAEYRVVFFRDVAPATAEGFIDQNAATVLYATLDDFCSNRFL